MGEVWRLGVVGWLVGVLRLGGVGSWVELGVWMEWGGWVKWGGCVQC